METATINTNDAANAIDQNIAEMGYEFSTGAGENLRLNFAQVFSRGPAAYEQRHFIQYADSYWMRAFGILGSKVDFRIGSSEVQVVEDNGLFLVVSSIGIETDDEIEFLDGNQYDMWDDQYNTRQLEQLIEARVMAYA